MDRRQKWRIDTTISLPNLVSLAATIGAGLWWAATFSATTEHKFREDDRRMTAIEAKQSSLDKIPERMASQEAKINVLLETAKEVRDELRDYRKADVSLRKLEIKNGMIRE